MGLRTGSVGGVLSELSRNGRQKLQTFEEGRSSYGGAESPESLRVPGIAWNWEGVISVSSDTLKEYQRPWSLTVLEAGSPRSRCWWESFLGMPFLLVLQIPWPHEALLLRERRDRRCLFGVISPFHWIRVTPWSTNSSRAPTPNTATQGFRASEDGFEGGKLSLYLAPNELSDLAKKKCSQILQHPMTFICCLWKYSTWNKYAEGRTPTRGGRMGRAEKEKIFSSAPSPDNRSSQGT